MFISALAIKHEYLQCLICWWWITTSTTPDDIFAQLKCWRRKKKFLYYEEQCISHSSITESGIQLEKSHFIWTNKMMRIRRAKMDKSEYLSINIKVKQYESQRLKYWFKKMIDNNDKEFREIVWRASERKWKTNRIADAIGYHR